MQARLQHRLTNTQLVARGYSSFLHELKVECNFSVMAQNKADQCTN